MVNGYSPELAGAASQDVLPIVGARQCRITRPLSAPAAHRGRYGRAWRVDLAAIRSRLTLFRKPDAMVAHWVVEAPWSSEVVHSYSLVLAHLRFQLGGQPATRYLEGATHELALWAINPQAERADMLARPVEPQRQWLQPAVFAAQLVCPSDEAAEKAVFVGVELICSGRLSPHPAHARSWAQLYGDNMLRAASAPEERGSGKTD